MIAQLPPDKMPPRPEGIPRFQRLFREAAGLNFDKADLERYEDFIDHRIHRLLLRAEANVKAGGDVLIEPRNLPITAGLRNASSMRRYRRGAGTKGKVGYDLQDHRRPPRAVAAIQHLASGLAASRQ
jgi:hypothetical protein